MKSFYEARVIGVAILDENYTMQLEAFCFLATRDDGVRESSASTAVPVLVQWHLVEQDSKVSMATMEAATTMYYKYITANTKKEENMIQSHNRSGGSR